MESKKSKLMFLIKIGEMWSRKKSQKAFSVIPVQTGI
jgi:hypothetical protein